MAAAVALTSVAALAVDAVACAAAAADDTPIVLALVVAVVVKNFDPGTCCRVVAIVGSQSACCSCKTCTGISMA